MPQYVVWSLNEYCIIIRDDTAIAFFTPDGILDSHIPDREPRPPVRRVYAPGVTGERVSIARCLMIIPAANRWHSAADVNRECLF